jgi:hypothetical protein
VPNRAPAFRIPVPCLLFAVAFAALYDKPMQVES